MRDKGVEENYGLTITEEEAWKIIATQASSHEHIQSQAQGVLRFIIAGTTIIATLGVQNFFSSVDPSQQDVANMAQNIPTNVQNLQGTTLWNKIILGFILLYCLTLLISSVWTLITLFNVPRLNPHIQDSYSPVIISEGNKYTDQFEQFIKNHRNSQYRDWIQENDEILAEEHSKFSKGITQLLLFGVGIFISIGIYAAIDQVVLLSLLLIDFMIVFITLIIFLILIKSIVSGILTFSIEGIKREVKNGFLGPMTELTDALPLNGVILLVLYLIPLYLSVFVLQFYVGLFVNSVT